MPDSPPQLDDILDQDVEVSDDTARTLICRLADANASLSYWRALAEERKVQIDRLVEHCDLTISYLKDRLNRAELPKTTD